MKQNKTVVSVCQNNEKDIGIDLLEMGLFLDRLDGKKDLAVRIISLFLKHYMEKQAGIGKAIENKNSKELHACAHSLKGMLLHFCKQGADLVYQLEEMGDSGKIDIKKAIVAYDKLKIIIDQIVPELKEYECRYKDRE